MSGGYDIRCTAWYFEGRRPRQCVTFEPDGFVWFAGWSDDTNLQPIIRGFLSWIDETSDEQFAAIPSFSQRESTGTFLGRAIFHTWFHTGEINAVRQMLGHPEIMFVGAAGGELAWVPSRGVER